MRTTVNDKDQILLDLKYKPLLLEALQELMYKIALNQEKMKGQAVTDKRRKLTSKQKNVEELQHLISIQSAK